MNSDLKQSVNTSKNLYIRKFWSYRVSQEFRRGGRFEKLMRKSTFWKEVTEAFAVRERIKKIVLANRKRIRFIVDVGCGKGFLALFSALFHPDLKVYAVDPDPSPDWSHFAGVENLEPLKMDMMSPEFENWLKSLRGYGIMAGIHLCTFLSIRFIDLYNRLENIRWALLMPCCVGEFDRNRFRWIIEEVGVYEAWVTYLSTIPVGRVTVLRDINVLSDKNMLLIMEKYC